MHVASAFPNLDAPRGVEFSPEHLQRGEVGIEAINCGEGGVSEITKTSLIDLSLVCSIAN